MKAAEWDDDLGPLVLGSDDDDDVRAHESEDDNDDDGTDEYGNLTESAYEDADDEPGGDKSDGDDDEDDPCRNETLSARLQRLADIEEREADSSELAEARSFLGEDQEEDLDRDKYWDAKSEKKKGAKKSHSASRHVALRQWKGISGKTIKFMTPEYMVLDARVPLGSLPDENIWADSDGKKIAITIDGEEVTRRQLGENILTSQYRRKHGGKALDEVEIQVLSDNERLCNPEDVERAVYAAWQEIPELQSPLAMRDLETPDHYAFGVWRNLTDQSNPTYHDRYHGGVDVESKRRWREWTGDTVRDSVRQWKVRDVVAAIASWVSQRHESRPRSFLRDKGRVSSGWTWLDETLEMILPACEITYYDESNLTGIAKLVSEAAVCSYFSECDASHYFTELGESSVSQYIARRAEKASLERISDLVLRYSPTVDDLLDAFMPHLSERPSQTAERYGSVKGLYTLSDEFVAYCDKPHMRILRAKAPEATPIADLVMEGFDAYEAPTPDPELLKLRRRLRGTRSKVIESVLSFPGYEDLASCAKSLGMRKDVLQYHLRQAKTQMASWLVNEGKRLGYSGTLKSIKPDSASDKPTDMARQLQMAQILNANWDAIVRDNQKAGRRVKIDPTRPTAGLKPWRQAAAVFNRARRESGQETIEIREIESWLRERRCLPVTWRSDDTTVTTVAKIVETLEYISAEAQGEKPRWDLVPNVGDVQRMKGAKGPFMLSLDHGEASVSLSRWEEYELADCSPPIHRPSDRWKPTAAEELSRPVEDADLGPDGHTLIRLSNDDKVVQAVCLLHAETEALVPRRSIDQALPDMPKRTITESLKRDPRVVKKGHGLYLPKQMADSYRR